MEFNQNVNRNMDVKELKEELKVIVGEFGEQILMEIGLEMRRERNCLAR